MKLLLESWPGSLPPCAVELVHFFRGEKGRQALCARPRAKLQLPVLAVQWPKGILLDTSAHWDNVCTDGVFNLLNRLQSGQAQPSDPQFELEVHCAQDHWVLCRESHTPRLAALLMFQCLHRDVTVVAPCRLEGNSNSGSLSVEAVKGHSLRVNCSDDEVLRIFLRGSPLERDVFAALFQVRAAQATSEHSAAVASGLAHPRTGTRAG